MADLHAWFKAGSKFLAWDDLDHTGAVYSAVKYLSAKTVVLIVCTSGFVRSHKKP